MILFRKFWLIAFSILIAGACLQKNNKGERPNIVLIMADDLGYAGIGCFGNDETQTPNLDKLAEDGLRFTDFHSNGAVCSPTRAALLSGKYQQRSGLEGVIYVRGTTRDVGMDSTVTTIADVLKNDGYKTGIFGKWHLGYKASFNPVNNGFEEFIGYRSGNIDYHTHYDNAGIFDWYHQQDTLEEAGYVTDLITDHSIEFIKRNKNNPFFLYIAHEAPHVPFQGRNDPGYRFPGQEFSYFGPVEDRHRAYRDMVEALDEGIGQVVQTIKETGILENTFIFFLSDNGGLQGYGKNGILRGAKSTLWEGGHRVPAIASWIGKIDAGVTDELVMSFDLFPTILEICDIKKPENLIFDGIDISPLLFSNENLEPRNVFWRYRNQRSVRAGEIKLLIIDADTLLFNLSTDLQEECDLSTDNAKVLDSLTEVLSNWEKEMNKYSQKTL
jgi:arylsulfatase A-like enzyme